MTTGNVLRTSNSSPAPVYDFYEIDKLFSEKKNESEGGPPEGDRVIPIYICKPLQKVVNLTPQQLEQQEMMKELQKIDEMEIEVIKMATPETKTHQPRKTRLIPLTFIQIKRKKATTPIIAEDNATNTEDISEEKPEDSNAMSNILNQSSSAAECDDQPNFHCEKCDQSFYMKRALRRHMYAHK